MQQINLYQAQFQPQKVALTPERMLQTVLITLALFASLSFYQAHKNSSLQSEIIETQQAIPITTESSTVSSPLLRGELDSLQKQYTEKQTFLNYLTHHELGNQQGFSQTLSNLSQQRIENVWLTSFSLRDAGHSVTLDGQALESNQIPLYIDSLAQGSQFQGKQFSVFELQQPDDSGIYTFKLQTNENKGK